MSIMYSHPLVPVWNREALEIANTMLTKRIHRDKIWAEKVRGEIEMLCELVLTKSQSTAWLNPAPSDIVTWFDDSDDSDNTREKSYAAWPLGNNIYLTLCGLKDADGHPIQVQTEKLVATRNALQALLNS